MASKITNEMRLKRMATMNPLVTGDEKIAVFGACGQIGSKLKPLLERLYPGKIIYCDSSASIEREKNNPHSVYRESALTPLDVTNIQEVEHVVKQNNVKVILHLAVLLSDIAEREPERALEVNVHSPEDLMRYAREWGIRKIQVMGSMAAQEHGMKPEDNTETLNAKQLLRGNSSPLVSANPKDIYGEQKLVLERKAELYSDHYFLDVSVPRMSGVLTCHLPWPAEGTTMEVDKMIVACAMLEVYGADATIELVNKEGTLVHKPLFKNGKYIPEVSSDVSFSMTDGHTLPEVVLMLLHQNLCSRMDCSTTPPTKIPGRGAVHNVYEYTVNMQQVADILKELNPGFNVEFIDRDFKGTRSDNAKLDPGKMYRADNWPSKMDTTSTEALTGLFKNYTAEESIRNNYKRIVALLKQKRQQDLSVSPFSNDNGHNKQNALG